MLHEIVEQVEGVAQSIVDDIHTVLPCKVVKYDKKKNLAKVKPIGEFLFGDGEKMEFPEIDEVPVMFPYFIACDIGIVFPVHKDDEMLLLISEIELDEWRTGAKSDAPIRFDITSAVAVPALIKKPNSLHKRAVDDNALIIKAKDAEIDVQYPPSGANVTIKVKGKKIKVSGNGIDITGDVRIEGDVKISGKLAVSEDVSMSKNLDVLDTVTADEFFDRGT